MRIVIFLDEIIKLVFISFYYIFCLFINKSRITTIEEIQHMMYMYGGIIYAYMYLKYFASLFVLIGLEFEL